MIFGDVDLEIVELFSKNVVAYYSINQIAKLITKTYPYVNKRVGYLHDEGILKKSVVGASHLCAINLASDKAVVMLSLAEIEKRDSYLKKNRELEKALELIDSERKKRTFHCIVMHNKQLLFVLEDSSFRIELQGYDTRCIDKAGFEKLLLDGAILREHVILSGFEKYFEFIRGVERELRLNRIPL